MDPSAGDRALRVADTIGHHTWVDSTRDVSRLLVHVVEHWLDPKDATEVHLPEHCATCQEALAYAPILRASLESHDLSHPR